MTEITFPHKSDVNAAHLRAVAAAKGCSCQPYEDWFTYDKWQALGMQVQRGEHGTRLPNPTYIVKTEEVLHQLLAGKRTAG